MAKEFRYLFFDTEMSGCEQIVSIGYIVTDRHGVQTDEGYFIIKPYKKISKTTIAIHGITTEQAKAEGITLRRGMARFINATKSASVWVGYAPQNDIVALAIGCKHLGRDVFFEEGEAIIVDVARMATPYMLSKGKINPGQSPSLIAVHDELTPDEPFAAHNALDDAKATAKCFWSLMKQGYFSFESIIPYRKVKQLCTDKHQKQNEEDNPPAETDAEISVGIATVVETTEIDKTEDVTEGKTPKPAKKAKITKKAKTTKRKKSTGSTAKRKSAKSTKPKTEE